MTKQRFNSLQDLADTIPDDSNAVDSNGDLVDPYAYDQSSPTPVASTTDTSSPGFFGSVWDDVKAGYNYIAPTKAGQAVGQAATNVGSNMISNELGKLTGGLIGTKPTATGTATTTTASTGLSPVIPALAVGAGLYLWKHSIAWAAGGAVLGYLGYSILTKK